MNNVYASRAADTDAGLDWRHHAVCRDEDPDLFFPIGDTGPAVLQVKEAKTICARCPVIGTCLQWALESKQEHGVWGGLSEKERVNLRRRAARRRGPRGDMCPI